MNELNSQNRQETLDFSFWLTNQRRSSSPMKIFKILALFAVFTLTFVIFSTRDLKLMEIKETSFFDSAVRLLQIENETTLSEIENTTDTIQPINNTSNSSFVIPNNYFQIYDLLNNLTLIEYKGKWANSYNFTNFENDKGVTFLSMYKNYSLKYHMEDILTNKPLVFVLSFLDGKFRDNLNLLSFSVNFPSNINELIDNKENIIIEAANISSIFATEELFENAEDKGKQILNKVAIIQMYILNLFENHLI